MKSILEVEHLTKKFGNFKALDDVSFKLKSEEVLGLIGANGAGKTTLSEIIAGVSKATFGKVKYNFKYKKTFKEKMGIQFQDSSYPSGLTVKDLILFAKNLHHVDVSSKKVKELLEIFQLKSFYKRKAKFLSYGQRQKLNIFLSIFHNPKIVILDELTTGLDTLVREEIIAFTKKMLKIQKISAILISHHMHEIKSMCKDVIVLSKGKIVAKTSIKKIEKKHKTLDEYMKNLISSSSKQTNKEVSNFSEFNGTKLTIKKNNLKKLKKKVESNNDRNI